MEGHGTLFDCQMNEEREHEHMGGNAIPPSDGSVIGRSRPVHLPFFNEPWAGNVLWLTVCAGSPRVRLDREDVHRLLCRIWGSVKSLWLVGNYVLMPDHLHCLVAPAAADAPPLKNWMKWWRQEASKRWPRPDEAPVWQRDYWDRQLRSEESLTERWHYMKANPVRAGLVTDAEDWPFQGRIHTLRV